MSTAEKQRQEDDSIEGILLSIREIMMSDGANPDAMGRQMDDAPVLDLTQLIRENGQVQEIPKPKAPIPEGILKEIDEKNKKNKDLAERLAQEEALLQQQHQALAISNHDNDIDSESDIEKTDAFQNEDQEGAPNAEVEPMDQEEMLSDNDDRDDQDMFLKDDDQTAMAEIADMLEDENPLEADELTLDFSESENTQQDFDLSDDLSDAVEISETDLLDDEDAFALENVLEASPDLDPQDSMLGGDALSQSLRHLDQLDAAVAQSRIKPDPIFDADATITTNIPSKSLEDVIVQAVQPYLKAWLNTHLPSIVEQKVQEEIRRLVNKKLGS